jgi:hypothetical protein
MQWKECITAWLEMEHRLGYLIGMVGTLTILFLVAAVNMASLGRKKNTNLAKRAV